MLKSRNFSDCPAFRAVLITHGVTTSLLAHPAVGPHIAQLALAFAGEPLAHAH
jgi:hypothetical protein